MKQENISTITVSVCVNATIEQVWTMMNEATHITKWYAASTDWHAPSATNDFIVGGRSNIRMEAKDGSFGFNFEWTYTNIIPLQQVDYILDDGRKVSITYQPTEAGILVTETFDPENENSYELQQMGWQSILTNFKQYVESHLNP